MKTTFSEEPFVYKMGFLNAHVLYLFEITLSLGKCLAGLGLGWILLPPGTINQLVTVHHG